MREKFQTTTMLNIDRTWNKVNNKTKEQNVIYYCKEHERCLAYKDEISYTRLLEISYT